MNINELQVDQMTQLKGANSYINLLKFTLQIKINVRFHGPSDLVRRSISYQHQKIRKLLTANTFHLMGRFVINPYPYILCSTYCHQC